MSQCMLLCPNYCCFPQFSFFGSRSTSKLTRAQSSSSSCSSSPVLAAASVKRPDNQKASTPGLSKSEFLERVRRSNQACQQGDYALAVRLYSESLSVDPQNCILFSNRSAAYLRLGQYSAALDDAIKARLINPKWPKVRHSASSVNSRVKIKVERLCLFVIK